MIQKLLCFLNIDIKNSCKISPINMKLKLTLALSQVLRSGGAGCETDLIVLAISVAATVLRQDAALAVEHIALVALAALHTVLAAVPLATGWGALGLTNRHATGVMAVRWTALD